MILYDLLKAGHIVSLVLWAGGMIAAALVLTRGGIETIARFQEWDARVTTPAMFATWALGLALAVWGNWFASGWMSAKLLFVLALSALHGILSGRMRRTAADGKAAAGAVVRLALPAMTACFCAIALLVVTKPF